MGNDVVVEPSCVDALSELVEQLLDCTRTSLC